MKIAFSGKMGSGKDTAVDYLINKINGTQISFAEPIYNIMNYAQNVAGFSLEKDRKFLQLVGTEWARNIDNNVWVNIALEKARKLEGNVFVSDLRFINEFESLKDDGWVCVKLIRNTSNNSKRAGTGSVSHISETILDTIPNNRWDYIIYNNGTLEKFYDQINTIVY